MEKDNGRTDGAQMSEINKTLFRVNKREGIYYAEFHVRGTIKVEIEASTEEEADEKAEAMMDGDDFGLELDDCEDIVLRDLSPARPMYLVTRKGETMQVSHLQEGDEPREPDENGF